MRLSGTAATITTTHHPAAAEGGKDAPGQCDDRHHPVSRGHIGGVLGRDLGEWELDAQRQKHLRREGNHRRPQHSEQQGEAETLRNRATHPSGVAGGMSNRNRRGNGAKRPGGELIDDRVQVPDHHPGSQRPRIEVGHEDGIGDRHRETDETDKRNRAGGPGEAGKFARSPLAKGAMV